MPKSRLDARRPHPEFVALSALIGLLLACASAQALAPAAAAQSETHCPPGQSPRLVFGFADLKAHVGAAMGDPVTCEFADPNGTGDIHQRTTTGLAFWRRSTNTPTFTNGWEHWGRTVQGWVYWTGSSIEPPPSATLQSGALPQPDAFYAEFLQDQGMTMVSRQEAELTGDGVAETIIHGTRGCGVSNCFYELFIFQGARQVSQSVGYSASTIVTIWPGRGLQLVNPVYRPGDPNCCPTGGFMAKYLLYDPAVGAFFLKDTS